MKKWTKAFAALGLGAALAVTAVVPAMAEEDKTWVIATDTVFRPFEFTNEDGEFVGIDVDIVAAIAEDQGFKYEMQPSNKNL